MRPSAHARVRFRYAAREMIYSHNHAATRPRKNRARHTGIWCNRLVCLVKDVCACSAGIGSEARVDHVAWPLHGSTMINCTMMASTLCFVRVYALV